MIKIPTFLKWAGGKRKIIKKLEPLFPSKIDRYFEPFLGAGAVFFFVKQKYNPKFCMISDTNKDLIDTFIAVRDNPKKLISCFGYFKKYNSEKFYYEIRKKFNRHELRGLKRTAAFIYLNKNCFNGLYRVNSKNEFNVPCGKYKKPEIYNEENIYFASKLLQRVKIKKQDYRKIKTIVRAGDFVYLDPCYDPIKKTSFANYTPKRFCETDRIEIAKFIRILGEKRVNIILSNNNLPKIKEIYSDFKIKKILAPRNINANPIGRKRIIELAISNF